MNGIPRHREIMARDGCSNERAQRLRLFRIAQQKFVENRNPFWIGAHGDGIADASSIADIAMSYES